ncbi:MAG: tetratricopeptide repeat protein [Chloroflexi bacterium]|nr:MAG: tetratricopeptide repeat protein [Chloroflexota bacterium]
MPQTVRTRRRRPAPVSRALKKLGERLREARAAAGISQAELGAPYFTRAHVSAIELGKIRPAMPALEHMARKLGKPASYFLDDADAERARRERELEMSAIGGLLTLTGAAEALRRTERLLDTDGLAVRDSARLRLAAGTALNLLHRGSDATRALTVAQRLAMELRDDPLGRAAEYQLAVATRISGNPRGARELLETLLRRLEGAKPPDRLLTLRILITLGGCAQDLGEPAAATTYYQRALEWSNEIGDLGRITFIHQGLGNVYRSLGDQDAAAGHYQKALAAAELAKDLVGVLIMHNALAVLSADAGRIESAYGHVARAIEIARVSGPAAYLAQCFVTRAEVALKAKDAPLARASAEEAIASVVERGAEADKAIAGATLVLAELDLRDGQTAAAERRMKEAAAMYQAIDSKADLADVLMRLSRVAKKRGDLRGAERYAARAYEITKPVGTTVEG